jgi:two-component system, NarL family, response regulator YdfI
MVSVWIMAPTPAWADQIKDAVQGHSIRVAGTASTFPSLRSLISETSAELAVIYLPSGLDAQVTRDWLSELVESTTVLLLSSDPDSMLVHRLLQAGSGGMLQADAPPEQIVQAIESLDCGLMVFDNAFAGLVRPSEPAMAESLTPRESEVLALLADGLGNREIASRLGISEHTIKFHIRSILGKLGASSRTEAVSRGLRSGLIEL